MCRKCDARAQLLFCSRGSAVLVAFAVKGVSFQSCARSLCCIKLELNLVVSCV